MQDWLWHSGVTGKLLTPAHGRAPGHGLQKDTLPLQQQPALMSFRIQHHREISPCTPALPPHHQPSPFSAAALDLSILFSFSDLPFFPPPPSFSLTCHTHTWSHILNPPRAADLPADLECGGAEGCPVTFCPNMSPRPCSPLIYCKGQVTSARKTDATITFPYSAALSPCFFLMEIVGKKNLLLLSKSYQIFIRVIL